MEVKSSWSGLLLRCGCFRFVSFCLGAQLRTPISGLQSCQARFGVWLVRTEAWLLDCRGTRACRQRSLDDLSGGRSWFPRASSLTAHPSPLNLLSVTVSMSTGQFLDLLRNEPLSHWAGVSRDAVAPPCGGSPALHVPHLGLSPCGLSHGCRGQTGEDFRVCLSGDLPLSQAMLGGTGSATLQAPSAGLACAGAATSWRARPSFWCLSTAPRGAAGARVSAEPDGLYP